MFFIIDGDKPIYEHNSLNTKEELRTLLQVHAVLDSIDYLQVQKKECYLGFVKFEDPTIVVQTTLTNLRMILLLSLSRKDCTKEVEEKIKGFFERVSEYLGIAIMNPLYQIHNQITSQGFDAKVRELMTKRLGVLIDKK